MGKELEAAKELTQEEIFFKRVQETARIPDDRFEKGKEFAMLVAEGTMPVYKAYAEVFDVELDIAQKKATKLKHGKWIQELIRYYQFDDDLEYTTETRIVVDRLMAIVKDSRSSPREVTEATKALQPYIKQQIAKSQVVHEVKDEAVVTQHIMSKMQNAIKQLAAQGKMVGQNGEIIDVELMT